MNNEPSYGSPSTPTLTLCEHLLRLLLYIRHNKRRKRMAMDPNTLRPHFDQLLANAHHYLVRLTRDRSAGELPSSSRRSALMKILESITPTRNQYDTIKIPPANGTLKNQGPQKVNERRHRHWL